ncbi:alpha/beta hydrolase [Agrobacterium vitis]|uniref:alpha/beta hydrolase n=1 Tax=Agrobacterium vitis TaxID=373 RepID=UPI0012E766FC|nr:alpha/beta hydrolase [Agrobacterium vitis]MVA24401.1 alpha/beta fold hydrolase [Agrobacterium vitis]
MPTLGWLKNGKREHARSPLTHEYTLPPSPSVNAPAACGPARSNPAFAGHAFIPFLVILVLGGCAGRPESVLKPVPVASDASQVNMLVFTTRKPADDPGLLYSGDRGTAISVNNVVVSIPPERNRKVGEVQWPSRVPPNPEHDFAVLKADKVPTESEALQWFNATRNKKRQAVIFVHGFNNTYSDAVFRFAQIVHDSGTDASPILFTWPSRGSVFDYLYDKESTTYSRRALEDLILQASKNPNIGEVTIISHSMGTWLTMEALRGVAMRTGRVPAKVGNVILASPDIDVDVFRRQLIEMGARRPHFTIFTSNKDKALFVSRWLSGGVNRVGGMSQADLQPLAADMKVLGITAIDTSSVDSHDPLGHTAFADSPEIIRNLGKSIAGQSMEGGQTTLGDRVGLVAIGTANLAGSAARTVVTAPMAVISNDARQSLKQEFSSGQKPLINGKIAY